MQNASAAIPSAFSRALAASPILSDLSLVGYAQSGEVWAFDQLVLK